MQLVHFLEVADGYGRNFLIARGLAEEATEGKVRELQQMQKTQKIKDDKKLKIAEEARKKLGGKVVKVKVNTGEGGKLFGSVTTAQIAEALVAQFSIPVDQKDLKIEETVTKTGEYQFKAKLYTGVEAEMTLKVESE